MVNGKKPLGQKKARRVEKDFVLYSAATLAKNASIDIDVTKHTDRTKINMMTLEAELKRQDVEREKVDLEREKWEHMMIVMDTNGCRNGRLHTARISVGRFL